VPLNEDQKKALKEKYKEHRREIWSGETSRSKKEKNGKENISEESVSKNSEETIIQEEIEEKPSYSILDKTSKNDKENDIKTIIDSLPEKDNSENIGLSEFTVLDDSSNPTEKEVLEENTTIIENQPIPKKEVQKDDIIQVKEELDQPRQLNSGTDDKQYELIDKIKEQRRATWAGESSRSMTKVKRQKEKEDIQENEEPQNNPNKENGGISWKLILGVFLGVTGAIGIGVLLGYYVLASLI